MLDPRQFGMGDPHEHPEANQSDPERYPRAAEITSTEFLMTIEAIQANEDRYSVLFKQARDLAEEMNIVRAERQIIDTKFWRAIREQYPHVVTDGQCGMGYRKHDGKFYVVSWGDEDKRENYTTPTQEEN